MNRVHLFGQDCFPFHYVISYDSNGQVYETAWKVRKQALGFQRCLPLTQVGLPLNSVPPWHCHEAKSTYSLSCVFFIQSFLWSVLRYSRLLKQSLSTQKPWAVAFKGWVLHQCISDWLTSFTHTSIQKGCWMLFHSIQSKLQQSTLPCAMITLLMNHL